jgi:hypothetical protein
MLRYTKLVESDPGLSAASLKIQIQYEEVLAAELSREAGKNPGNDLYSRLLAALLVDGNFSVARMVLSSDSLDRYESVALSVVDFAIHTFPSRAEFESLPSQASALSASSDVLGGCPGTPSYLRD